MRFVIKKKTQAHCARGSDECVKCKSLHDEGEKYCLLELGQPDPEVEAAMPVTEVEIDGKKTFIEYSIVKVFKDKKEAEGYARKNKIKIYE